MSRVRVAGLAARSELVELDAACFARPWTADAWTSELRAETVLVVGSPICGLACAPVIVDVCELRRIAVHPQARRRGLAGDLLRATIDRARESGCVRVELEVGAANASALALYRRHGFCVVGQRPGYYRDPPDDALLMDLDLGSGPPENDV